MNLIDLTIAKKAKENGFNKPTEYYYLDKELPFVEKGLKRTKNGEKINHNEFDSFIYSAPTIEEHSLWLKTWRVIPHFHQIADTGDYDGVYEITNGSVSIFTKDDNDDGLDAIVKAFNDSDCEFHLNDEKEFELHLAKQQITDLENKVKELEWILEGLRK